MKEQKVLCPRNRQYALMDLYKQLLWPNRNICWPVIQKANDIKKKSDSQVDPVISQQGSLRLKSSFIAKCTKPGSIS